MSRAVSHSQEKEDSSSSTPTGSNVSLSSKQTLLQKLGKLRPKEPKESNTGKVGSNVPGIEEGTSQTFDTFLQSLPSCDKGPQSSPVTAQQMNKFVGSPTISSPLSCYSERLDIDMEDDLNPPTSPISKASSFNEGNAGSRSGNDGTQIDALQQLQRKTTNNELEQSLGDMDSINSKLAYLESDVVEIKRQCASNGNKLTELSLNVARLLRQHLPGQKAITLPAGLTDKIIPVQSLDGMDFFSDWLSRPLNWDAMIDYLLLLPISGDEYHSAMNMMPNVMTNFVGSHYNFSGKSFKLPLQEAKLWAVVKGALAQKFNKGFDAKKAISGVQAWLKDAPRRDGGVKIGPED